ncbi:MAG: Na+/H+ antiporter subunit E [Terricaulis sp.]|nr:Na+/H+ antiporter subunit E [Terricaulis sp.]
MKRIMPYPLMSLALLAIWVLLNNSVTPAVLASGVLLSFLAPLAYGALERPRVIVGNVVSIVRLLAIVLFDITRSNFAVGTIILAGRRRERVSGFVQIPLTMTDPNGLAILAVIITSTPGTLWVQYDSRRQKMLLHVLDLVEPEYWVTLIKDRYERRLMEIFE